MEFTVVTPSGRKHPARFFPGLAHVLSVSTGGGLDKATMDLRRVTHSMWVGDVVGVRRKALDGELLTRKDMERLRDTWNATMTKTPSPYVPWRAVTHPDWAVAAAGTSALTCKEAAPNCPFREAMLATAAEKHVEPGHPAHTLRHMAAMAMEGKAFASVPPPVHGHVA